MQVCTPPCWRGRAARGAWMALDKRARVLSICGLEDDWFRNRLFGDVPDGGVTGEASAAADSAAAVAAWERASVDHVFFSERAAQQIGDTIRRYNAVVCCDLSASNLELFERRLGAQLQAFARQGGLVAFTARQAPPGVTTRLLQRLFDVVWEPCESRYGKRGGRWGPLRPAEGATFVAPASTPIPYAMASTLTNVPPHERVCGATDDAGVYAIGAPPLPAGESRASDLAPVRVTTVAYTREDGDFLSQEDFEVWALAQGLSAAAHTYGIGGVAYFGDAACSRQLPPLVAAYCTSRFEAEQRLERCVELGLSLAHIVVEERRAAREDSSVCGQ